MTTEEVVKQIISIEHWYRAEMAARARDLMIQKFLRTGETKKKARRPKTR